ncbi:MAG: hypothetical protein JSW12_02570, partial [Deltaproteobacteria bacterium]
FAEGDGIFPWPSSPGQGNNNLLCDLCVSVVNSRAMPSYNIRIRSKGYKDIPLFSHHYRGTRRHTW